MEHGIKLPPSWHEEASCANHPDPDLWWYEFSKFKDETDLQVLRTVEAIQICNDCPVRELCLKQGLEDENVQGGSIWGGLMTLERRQLLKRPVRSLIKGETEMVRRVRQKVAKVA